MSEANISREAASGAWLQRAIAGFAAGFLAVPLAHQPMVELLHLIGLVPWTPYSTFPVPPWGVPLVLSASFWGGVWGIVFAFVSPLFPRGGGYWVSAILFGALALTLVSWFIVSPIKGLPLAAGFDPARMAGGLLVNGAWGFGTALLLLINRSLTGNRARSR